ncbi:MAG: ATP-binding protein [Smithellaceae bacterium]
MLNKLYQRFKNLGILPKLLISYLILSIIPLIIMGYIANKNLSDTGILALQRAEEIGNKTSKATEDVGKTAIADSVAALDRRSTEAIELRTVELAMRIADFLYERDKDIRILSSLKPDPQNYLNIYLSSNRDIIATEPVDVKKTEKGSSVVLSSNNPENKEAWRHLPPLLFNKLSKPLYKEVTFVDLQGQEKIKIMKGEISNNLLDISKKENTYCKAEDYFHHLKSLKPGEIYVSRVIGAHLKGWLYNTPDGIEVKTESAYAGKENPRGRKFEGIVRWAAPVWDENHKKAGYVTMALDHTHIMEFTDHILPTEERFTVLSDGGSGNYAFIWDNEDRCISHARDFFICGFNPDNGEEIPGWLSRETYEEYKKSGLTLEAFVQKLPSFRNFTQHKTYSAEQMKSGNISLDCKVLDTAPQCQGWHEGTEDGGSGSFLILWSGLWKLTTYAAIPYYTGPYGKSKRGFGYVTIGANVDDFHRDANITQTRIEKNILKEKKEIVDENNKTRALINENASRNRMLITVISIMACLAIISISILLSLNITRPLRQLTDGAVAISKGNFEQSIKVNSQDEIGRLAKSFNEMAKTVSEVDKMKSDFVTTASHELRTPIQAMMLGISGVLEGYSGKIDQEVREDLELAKLGIERLMQLITNLLDISRIEAQKTEFTVTDTPVAEIIDRAIAEVAPLAYAHRHTIRKYLPDNLHIQADRDRMIQVMINLLSNSIKYSPDGGKIIVKAERKEDKMMFTVADNGYGIPQWAKEEVFKKFFQADSIMSQKVGGSGLGLTITKGIVEKHGGYIYCESPLPEGDFPELPRSSERKGAIFIIELPLPSITNT